MKLCATKTTMATMQTKATRVGRLLGATTLIWDEIRSRGDYEHTILIQIRQAWNEKPKSMIIIIFILNALPLFPIKQAQQANSCVLSFTITQVRTRSNPKLPLVIALIFT